MGWALFMEFSTSHIDMSTMKVKRSREGSIKKILFWGKIIAIFSPQ
jgi:hypothetical protein